MASINSVTIDLKFTGLNNLEQATKKMRQVQTEVKRLAKEERAGSISSQQYAKRVDQLAKELSKIAKGNRNAANSVVLYSKQVRAGIKAEEDSKKAAEANKIAQQQLEQVRKKNAFIVAMQEQRLKEEAKAARETAAANAALQAEEERLKRKYVEGYAAMDIYSKEMNDLAVARKAGIISAQQQRAEVEKLNIALANGSLVGRETGRGMNRLGVLFQQTGYQVGDFAVQVQSGTHFMVALGQQATQLVGTFAMLAKSTRMIAIFSGLGIVVPIATAVIGAFMRANEGMGESADKAGSAIRSVNDAVNDLDKNIPNLTAKMQALQMGFKSVEEAARTMLIADYTKQIIQIDNALSEFGTGVKPGGRGGGGKDPRVTALEQERAELQKLIEDQEKAIVQDRIRQNAAEISAKLVGDQAQEAKNVANAQKEIGYVLEDSVSKMNKIRSETVAVSSTSIALARSFAATANEAIQIAKALDEGTLSAQQLSGVNINAGVLLAAKSAQQLAKNLGISLRTAMAMAGMVSGIQGRGLEEAGGFADPRSPGYDPAMARIESVRATMESGVLSSFRDIPSVGGGGGGGGGAGAAGPNIAEEFERLKRSIDDAYEASQKFKESKDVLDRAMASGVIKTTEEYNRLLGLLREEYDLTSEKGDTFADNMMKIAQTARDALGDAFMSIVDGTKSASDAFSDMARIILKQAFELLVIKPILDGIFGGLTGGGGGGNFLTRLLGFSNGDAFSGGNVIPFANGGVVGGPTLFPMRGAQTGLMGEDGPEAIMPLKRGKGGKLGVVAEGSSQPVVINQSFNFQANGDDSVKRIIAQEAPKIANLTQKQIMDQRRRGGAMKAIFG